MRRLERLISQIRRLTDNEQYDNDPETPLGITTQEIVEYLNDAQQNIQSSITLVHPKVFVKTTTIDLVANQELYDLPADLFLGGRIIHVGAKFSENAADYVTLTQKHIKSRLPDVTSEVASNYIRIGDQIAIQPTPSRAWTAGIRITYQKKLPELGVRLGLVADKQITAGELTRIDLNLSPAKAQDIDLPTLAEHYVTQFDFVTIADKNGVIKAESIPVTSYDSTTGYITVDDGHTLGVLESITAGDYVIGGKSSTTHSELPDTCERYLIAYAAWKILKADSMVDSRDQERELAAMLEEIVNSFKEIDEDPIELELDEDWII